jgi:hypothetical protein
VPPVARTTPLVVLLVLAGISAFGAGGVTGTATRAASAQSPQLLLDFESGGPRGRVATRFGNAGTGAASMVVRSAGGGVVKVVRGRAGGRAARFPGYPGSSQGRAAILVSTADSRATVSPGRRAFTFGGSFRIDPVSSGEGRDNGDNLIQRGNYGSRGQYKIQLDDRVPSCRVKGDAGTRFVRARARVTPDRWYAVTCRRTTSGLRLSVKSFAPGSTAAITRTSGPTGNIVLGTLRLSVGGKVGPNGAPLPSADQFTGVVDNVFLRMD